MQAELLERIKKLRLMIFDVDGVLTDGTLYVAESGAETKAFNVLDGHGLKLLMNSGVEIALLSARRTRVVEIRAAELGIAIVKQGAADKRIEYERLVAARGITPSETGFMGDDLPDLPVLVRCGFAATVPAAPEAVRSRAHYVTNASGGRGAAREVCDLIMKGQNTLDAAIARYVA